MGQWLQRLIESEFKEKATLLTCVDQGDSLEPLLGAQVVIDFSSPGAMVALASKALESSNASLPVFIVGSTGWKIDERRELESLAEKTPVLMSSNFSLGVLALQEALRTISPLLEGLGYTPVIVETHHKHKKDAPSGTALALQRAISPAGPGNVQTHAIRAGEIIGDHSVTYHGVADTLTFSHHAQDRSIFARGAIEAALWLHQNRERAFGPKRVLGIEVYFNAIKEQLKP